MFFGDLEKITQKYKSSDPKVRGEALSELFEAAYYQGDLNSSDCDIIVRFFAFVVLQQESDPDLLSDVLRYLLLLQMAALQSYKYFLESRSSIVWWYLSWQKNLRDLDRFDPEDSRILENPKMRKIIAQDLQTREEGILSAVFGCINQYLNLLEHESSRVRIAATYVLSCCHCNSSKIVSALVTRLQYETDELVRSAIPVAIALLCHDGSRILVSDLDVKMQVSIAIPTLNKILNSDDSKLVRLSCAIAIAYIEGDRTSNSVITSLSNLLETEKLYLRFHENVYGRNTSYCYGDTLELLNRLGDDKLAKLIPNFLKGVGSSLGDIIDLVVEIAIFPERVKTVKNVSELTDVQRIFLQEIVGDDRIWSLACSDHIEWAIEQLGIREKPAREKLREFLQNSGMEI